jgi:multidrug efflux system membrane fusion protein
MEFDPDNHATQPVVSRKRSRLPSRSVLTAITVFGALATWLMSGVISDSAEPVEMATPLAESFAAQGPFKVVVQELVAERHTNRIRLQARTEADKLVTVASETVGTVSKLPVAKGAFVQKGQILCQLDIGARRANLDQARAMRDARKIEFLATQKLNAKGHASKSQTATARANYDAAIAAVKSAMVEFDRTKIKAPFDGILDRQPVKQGQFVGIGQPCGTVIDKDPLLIVGHIAESQITHVTQGAMGSAKLATGEIVEGVVRYIAETPNMTTRTFRVELEVANKDLTLRDGISAEMELQSGEVLATRIPQSVLTLGDKGKLGVRVVEDNRVAFRPVTVISDSRQGALVIGLAAREKVIMRGGEFTRDGRAVDFEIETAAQAAANRQVTTQ